MKFCVENDEIFIDKRPKKQDLDEILFWLKKEKEDRGNSFYCNKRVIESAFDNGGVIAFKQGKKNIGLVVWSSINKLQADIDIFVIHPDYRGQGYGRLYYNEIIDFFKSRDFKVVKLFCAPTTSEDFWKKMGLIKFPNSVRTEHELTYYTILVDTASIENIGSMDKIELWDVEPYEAKEKQPKWTWYVEINDDILSYPIIQPCDCNWNMRWSRNNQVIREEKVKYFTNEDSELYYKPFLYINELRK